MSSINIVLGVLRRIERLQLEEPRRRHRRNRISNRREPHYHRWARLGWCCRLESRTVVSQSREPRVLGLYSLLPRLRSIRLDGVSREQWCTAIRLPTSVRKRGP